MLCRLLLFTIFILLSVSGAAAQTNRPSQTPNTEKFPNEEKNDSHMPGDMLKKMEIARKENEHKKVLEDVDKLSDLSGEIARSYGERKQVSAEDVKKLGTIEKLAKRVLSGVGGEEFDEQPGTGGKIRLADAIEKLNTAAANIKKEMKAETRFVVSAVVVANSNEVITLARFIRHNQKED